MRDLLYLLFGYLSGCVLYAEVFSRVFHKEIASAAKDKNPGAANAFVHGGFCCGMLTLAGDMLKGIVPVALYMHYLPEALLTPLAPLVLCAPVAGHVFPATRSFKGGKGILCSGTLLLLLDWRIAAIGWGLFLLIWLTTRYVSLGSVTAAVSFPITTVIFYWGHPTVIVLAVCIAALVIWAHRTNIGRLLRGTESKFQWHKNAPGQ